MSNKFETIYQSFSISKLLLGFLNMYLQKPFVFGYQTFRNLNSIYGDAIKNCAALLTQSPDLVKLIVESEFRKLPAQMATVIVILWALMLKILNASILSFSNQIYSLFSQRNRSAASFFLILDHCSPRTLL